MLMQVVLKSRGLKHHCQHLSDRIMIMCLTYTLILCGPLVSFAYRVVSLTFRPTHFAFGVMIENYVLRASLRKMSLILCLILRVVSSLSRLFEKCFPLAFLSHMLLQL